MLVWQCNVPDLKIEIQFGIRFAVAIFANDWLIGKGRIPMLKSAFVQFEENGTLIRIDAWNYGTYAAHARGMINGELIVGVPMAYLRRGSRDTTQT